ncbi:unnamed protein product [Dovyalis caffra]|uniref:Uncharacterized protein n=1 Tax=Dovyalis caffra TaxID=77055 RepID=A0AAV1SNX0_9ROSI|nr:unnamed protein product [Dovyalis caffra]
MDMFADSRAPISAQLPLLFRGFSRSNTSSRSTAKEGGSPETNINSFACMQAISASSSEVPSVLEILQMKQAKQLCITSNTQCYVGKKSMSMVAKAIDVLVTPYSQSLKTGSYLRE